MRIETTLRLARERIDRSLTGNEPTSFNFHGLSITDDLLAQLMADHQAAFQALTVLALSAIPPARDLQSGERELPTTERATLTDKGVALLGGLYKLNWLDLSHNSITSKGLQSLRGLKSLTALYLEGNHVRLNIGGSDTSDFLASFPLLQDLNIAEFSIQEQTPLPVRGLTELRHLVLRDTGLHNRATSHFDALTAIETLDLSGTNVRSFNFIRGMPGLEQLFLDGCPVRDTTLANLRHCPRLTRVGLAGTLVSDKGLPHLSGLAGAQEINLFDTLVSEDGATHLRKTLSSCNVLWQAQTK